ncbi:hypothetical protein LOTGIDRAFT_230203 [Lottia gigantea]|uniref:ribonuclease Z n=1 Tax=Lottia gigantea TaxID=225164 RepID=V4CND6_LOTGI|nr:hypothetical protein LOTGIDRAFT_230203 [Lottia gigantea]ESP03890.1 hypothetical protein LOTGIDRAFT_230203 [Lottia gigantea]
MGLKLGTSGESFVLCKFHKIQTRTYSLKSGKVIPSETWYGEQKKKTKSSKVKEDQKISQTDDIISQKASDSIDVHIVGKGSKGFSRAVVINTTSTRYLFNCGEGIQRFFMVDKLKIAKIEHLFLTSNSWSNIGGLIGLLFMLENIGVPKITLHGPPNVEGISSMCKHLGQSDGTKLEKRLLTEGNYEDNNFKFQYVPFFRKKEKTDEAAFASKKPKLDSLPVEVSVAYICTPKPSIRRIDIQKCIELDIAPGPCLNLVKTGESVTLEDGRVINSEDILKPLVQSPSFIKCSHSGFLTPLINNEGLKKYQNTDENTPVEMTVDLIIHLTPEHIVKLPEYQQWINSFGANVKHMIFEDTFSNVMDDEGSKIQSHLNLLHPELFPLLPALTTPTSTLPDMTSNIITGENNLKYHYKPYTQLSRELITQPNLEDFQSEITRNPEITEAIDNFKQEVAKLKSEIPKDDRVYPEIVFLGTGASTSSKFRNFSGILLRLDDSKSIMLDCGEATISQLYDHYGEKTDSILRTLNGVFISHMHADHHLGLCGIIQARLDAFGKEKKDIPRLIVAAPSSMKRWINYIDGRIYPVSAAIKFFPLQRLKLEDKLNIAKLLNLDDFNPVDVNHCLGAKGLCLKYNGFKLVYSGDTMPCNNLVRHGKDCDILIHEATFDEGMEKEAKFKMHSTTTQAIEIGQKMKAKQIILTHFSQRFKKVPNFTNIHTSNVSIAFDHMTVRPCDYPYLSLLLKPLAVMFEDAIKINNIIKMKRTQKDALKLESEAAQVKSHSS